jgi:Fe-S cluster assembly protein SufD
MNESLNRKFQSMRAALNGSTVPELVQFKEESLNKLKDLGLPSRKNEEYKYTFLSNLFTPELIESELDSSLEEVPNLPRLADNSHLLVVVNGVPNLELSSTNDDKITVSPIEEGESSELINKLGGLSSQSKDAFVQLNSGLWFKGFLIDVPKGHTVKDPLIVHYVSTHTETAFVQPRGLINVAENAEINLIEVYSSKTASALNNQVVEIYAAESSRVNYIKIQDEGESDSRLDHTFVQQKQHSLVNVYTLTFGGKTVRNNLQIDLVDENCESHMYGLYLGKGKTHIDNHTTVDHIKPNCFSNELYKGVLDDKSTGVFNGKIFVRQDAQKTNAFQSNKNILLTDDATINTKPQLEIWADDVKCSHGCTNGQLDEEQLFYLRSRGISEKDAKNILLHAFAADVLDNIKIPDLKEMLDEMVTKRLH